MTAAPPPIPPPSDLEREEPERVDEVDIPPEDTSMDETSSSQDLLRDIERE